MAKRRKTKTEEELHLGLHAFATNLSFLERQGYDPPPVVVAIDPGVDGAIAFMSGTQAFVIDIPVYVTYKREKGKRRAVHEYVHKTIVYVFSWFAPLIKSGKVHAVLEKGKIGGRSFRKNKNDPNAKESFGDTPMTAFKVGWASGMWPLFFAQIGCHFAYTDPMAWKPKFDLIGTTKKESLALARKKFRSAEIHLEKHHNRADALLIAHYYTLFKLNGGDHG